MRTYSKQFTLKQLYLPRVRVVPDNEDQARELLHWLESTGNSRFTHITHKNPNYKYTKTCYNLHKGSFDDYYNINKNEYTFVYWSDIPDTIKEQQMTIQEFLNTDESAIKLNSFLDVQILNTILPNPWKGIESKSKFEEEQLRWGDTIYFYHRNNWNGSNKHLPTNLYSLSDFIYPFKIDYPFTYDSIKESLKQIDFKEIESEKGFSKSELEYLLNTFGILTNSNQEYFVYNDGGNPKFIDHNSTGTWSKAFVGRKSIFVYVNKSNEISITHNKPIAWVNPKPTKPNTQPIQIGSLCLVDNYPFPLTCTEIANNYYTLQLPDSTNVVFDDPKTIYPLTKLKTTGYKIGDIINTGNVWYIYTGDASLPPISDTESGHYRINYSINGSEADIQIVTKFSCGTLVCAKSNRVITEELPNNSVNVIESTDTYSHHQIKTHYSIPIILAKDEELFKELQVTLDHPLNVESKEFALLVGPSGSGKTELAIKYANSRNLPYIKMQITSQTTVDDYIGYKSITTGKYFPSLLREAVEKGYTLILDELDAGNPNSTLVLNGLKQSHFQFPDKLIKIHPDFRVIATANTLEYSEEYNSRMPMDKATLDRFHIIHYSMEDHHLAIRYGLDYIKQIQTKDKTPRQIEREVRQLKIHEDLKQTNYYN